MKTLRQWHFKDKLYFDIRKRQDFINYNDITFFYGLRGNGKSYSAKNFVVRRAVDDWIRYQDQDKVREFGWTRKSWEVIKEGIDTWGDEIQLKDGYYIKSFKSGIWLFQDETIYDKKGNEHIKERLKCRLGHWLYTSSPAKFKSKDFNNVNTIVLDEFIDEYDQYWVNEPEKFMSIVSSVARTRKVQVICIGNNVRPENPYFSFYDIGKDDIPKISTGVSYLIGDKGSEKIVGIEFVDYSERLAVMQGTSTAGRLAAGTDYGNYAQKGAWLVDNSNMVMTNPDERIEFKWNVKLFGIDFEVHTYGKYGYYIRPGSVENKTKIFLTSADAETEGKGSTFYSPEWIVQLLRNAGNVNRIFFKNVDTKESFILWLSKFK